MRESHQISGQIADDIENRSVARRFLPTLLREPLHLTEQGGERQGRLLKSKAFDDFLELR